MRLKSRAFSSYRDEIRTDLKPINWRLSLSTTFGSPKFREDHESLRRISMTRDACFLSCIDAGIRFNKLFLFITDETIGEGSGHNHATLAFDSSVKDNQIKLFKNTLIDRWGGYRRGGKKQVLGTIHIANYSHQPRGASFLNYCTKFLGHRNPLYYASKSLVKKVKETNPSTGLKTTKLNYRLKEAAPFITDEQKLFRRYLEKNN